MFLEKTNENTYHFYVKEKDNAMLYRYQILKEDDILSLDDKCQVNGEEIYLQANKRELSFHVTEKADGGFRLTLPLSKKERLFGLGDATRERVMVRGLRTHMHVSNVKSYGPMPFLMSSDGWGLIVNTTYRSVFDCAATNCDELCIETEKGTPDFYFFIGSTLKELLSSMTKVSGRPMILPKFAYGLTFVQNEESDIRSILWDIRTLRDRNIPCDTMGLEPSWMSEHYDYSTNKKWNPEKFPIPYWQPINTSSDFTFFYPMREMGMQLSLWLCTEYDLFYAEDKNLHKNETSIFDEDTVIGDLNFTEGKRIDPYTKPEEPWFEHLKKFVDNGAAAFKLDGSNQICDHPDRLWGGKYLDDEVHNIYPVILAKQMQQGFQDYTGRRLLLYTSGAYLGTQQYAATWAGDTGGGNKPLVSMMNYAMCGHSNTACDIDVPSPFSIHFGFLTPWAQYFCWSNWRYPWFLRDSVEEMIRFYANLRSSLFPYFYSMAHVAYETGLTIMRPLPLMYEDTNRFDYVTNAYMLGDKFYVGAFDMKLPLPDGTWVDYWNGNEYEGGEILDYACPENRGGALLVKKGSIFVTMVPQKYILEKNPSYQVQIIPGGNDTFTLYEDDGFTNDYQEGKLAKTLFRMVTEKDIIQVTIQKREGNYEGRPNNGFDISNSSIPEIKGMPEIADMEMILWGNAPKQVILNAEPISFQYDAVQKKTTFVLPKELHESGDCIFVIEK